MEPLTGYQSKALAFCKSKPASYLALDMGLGKTRVCLEWMQNYIDEKVLIIAPLRAIHTTWPDEIKKWGFNFSSIAIHGPKKDQAIFENRDVYLVNFEGIVRLFSNLKKYFSIHHKLPFKTLVIDEGSMVKSPKTKRFRALKYLAHAFTHKIILSGTPSPNSLMDLWSQFYLLDGGARLEETYTAFKRKWCAPLDYHQFTWVVRSKQAKEEIQEAVKDIMYRLSAEDYVKLPKTIMRQVNLELPKNLRTQYDTLEKDFTLELDNRKGLAVFNAAALSMKLRQFAQGGLYTDEKGSYKKIHTLKLATLEEMVISANGKGILCPIQFKFELDMIRSKFPNVPAIVGGVSAADSTKYIKDWNDKKIPLLVCHPRSMSHALNLQFGSNVIVWYSLPWSSEQYLQLNKRLCRLGQLQDHVTIYHLVIKDTVDEAVRAALQRKIKGLTNFLNFIETFCLRKRNKIR